MSLRADRTTYDGNPGQVFHLVPATFTAYSDVVRKYGGYNVFKFNAANFVKLMGRCMSGRNDHILVYPGTYTLTAALLCDKNNVTIKSVTGNAADVLIDGQAGVTCFNITGSGVQLRNLGIQPDDAASTPADGVIVAAAADAGIIIDGCNFIGDDKDVVCIDSEGARLTVTNCRFEDNAVANIQSNGENCVFKNNYFNSDNASFKGIELTAGSWCVIENNYFDSTGGTTDYGIYMAATCKLGAVRNNVYHATIGIDCEVLSGATPSFHGNEETGTTGTIAYVIGTTT